MSKRAKNSTSKKKELDDELKDLIQKKKNEKEALENLLKKLNDIEIK